MVCEAIVLKLSKCYTDTNSHKQQLLQQHKEHAAVFVLKVKHNFLETPYLSSG